MRPFRPADAITMQNADGSLVSCKACAELKLCALYTARIEENFDRDLLV